MRVLLSRIIRKSKAVSKSFSIPESNYIRESFFSLSGQFYFFVTLASFIFLFYLSLVTVSPFFEFIKNKKETTWTIKPFLPPTNNTNEGLKRTIQIRKIYVDGKNLRWKYIKKKGVWKEGHLNDWSCPFIWAEAKRGAELSFKGNIAQIFFLKKKNSGKVLILGSHGFKEVIDLNSPKNSYDEFIFEVPPLRPNVVFNASFILFGLCFLILFKIWSTRTRRFIWIILFLSLAHLFVFTSFPVGANNDSPGYVWSVHSFFITETPSYFPPGYPILIQLAKLVPFLGLGHSILLLQHILMVLSLACFYFISLRLFGGKIGYLFIILLSCMECTLFLPQMVISENVALTFSIFSLFFALRSSKSRHLFFSILAGSFAGIAVLARVSPLAGLVPALGLIYLFGMKRKWLSYYSVSLASIFLTLLLPMLWCFSKSGKFGLANSTGLHLYQRMIFQQKLVAKNRPFTKKLLKLMDGKNISNIPHWGISSFLKSKGVTLNQTERLLYNVSIESLREYPFKYFVGNFQNFWSLITTPFPYDVIWNEQLMEFKPLDNPAILTVSKEGIIFFKKLVRLHRDIWKTMVWAAILSFLLALFRLQKRYIETSFAIFIIFYIFAQVSVEVVCGRYNMVIAPFVAILCGSLFVTIKDFFLHHIRAAGIMKRSSHSPSGVEH